MFVYILCLWNFQNISSFDSDTPFVIGKVDFRLERFATNKTKHMSYFFPRSFPFSFSLKNLSELS